MILNLSSKKATEKEKLMGIIDPPEKFQKMIEKIYFTKKPEARSDYTDYENEYEICMYIHNIEEIIARIANILTTQNPKIEIVLIEAEANSINKIFEKDQINKSTVFLNKNTFNKLIEYIKKS